MANPFAPAQVNIAGGVQGLMQQFEHQRAYAKQQQLETTRKQALAQLMSGNEQDPMKMIMGYGRATGDIAGMATLAAAAKATRPPELTPDAILAHQDRMAQLKALYPWANAGGEPGQVTGGDTGAPSSVPHPGSAGELAADKKYAAGDYLGWLQGGFSETEQNLKSLQHVKDLLDKNPNVSGPIIGPLVKKAISGNEDILTIAARKMNTEAFNAAQAHQRAVVASLRPLVGARAAQQLFQSVLQTTYDPSAEPEENSRRIGLVMENIRKAAVAKQQMSEYFKANGTLSGYAGPTFDPEQFNPSEGVDTPAPPPPQNNVPAPGQSLGLPGMQTVNTPPPDQMNAEQTATGPNGHKIVVRNGVWVDAQTGQPLQ